MAGTAVSRESIDWRSGDAVLSLRSAFDKVESVAKWLANNSPDANGDPLQTMYNYSADEAYLIRLVFQDLEAIRTNSTNATTFDTARKLTGLD